MFNFTKIAKQDLIITFAILLLAIISLVAIFSTTFYLGADIKSDFPKQIVYLIIGFAIYNLLISLDSSWLAQTKIQVVLYILNLLVLIYLLVNGEVIASTKRWIDLGVISIQPAEFAKLIIIFITGVIWFGSNRSVLTKLEKLQPATTSTGNPIEKMLARLSPTAQRAITKIALNSLAILPIIVLILKQPSLGNAAIAFSLWFMMLICFAERPLTLLLYGLVVIISTNVVLHFINFSYPEWGITPDLFAIGLVIITAAVLIYLHNHIKFNIVLVIACFVIGFSIGQISDFTWNQLLSSYQRDRVISFVDPNIDPQGSGWQVSRAKIAIASAGLGGFGLLQGPQVVNNLLPFPYTDFIFAGFTEQFGLIGAGVLLGIYAILLYRIIYLADQIHSPFGKTVIIGIVALVALNIIINVGMNIGLMPVTGVPLPLISYGGSSVIIIMIGLSIVQMIYTEHDLSSNHTERLFMTHPN